MKVLITAGGTDVMIDQVRKIGNIFNGKTGKDIAEVFNDNGVDVTLLTSNMNHINEVCAKKDDPRIKCVHYKTYDHLFESMGDLIKEKDFDVIIHSSAVSDYYVTGTFIKDDEDNLVEIDSSTKIDSNHKKLYLEMQPTEKIIDWIRDPWGFKGTLVKFKLQVGMTDIELLGIAEKSRAHSGADLIVANCKEWMKERAFVCDEYGYETVERSSLPLAILNSINTYRS